MKLVIFGSTGGTGRQLIRQALEKDYNVTAFARNSEKLDMDHRNLLIIQGDVLDYYGVKEAVQRQDAVLCALGSASPSDKSYLRAHGTENILRTMEETGVKRFVCQSALGVGDSSHLLPFHYKYFLIPLLLRQVYADHELQENKIKKSKLDWTIVRPGVLTDGKLTGKYQHGFTEKEGKFQSKISRADTAEFMLGQIAEERYLHQTPCLSY